MDETPPSSASPATTPAPTPEQPLPQQQALPSQPAWSRFTLNAPAGERLPDDTVLYGADIAGEAELKLLGSLDGKRVLDLGCGAGAASIAFARQGAKVIAVDDSAEQVNVARQAAEREGVRIELHNAPLAELAFIRADTIDAVYSAFALAGVDDLDRVFRQLHRVLRPERPFVLSLPHPAFDLVDPNDAGPLQIRRSYWERTPVTWSGAPDGAPDRSRTIAELFTSLSRANFRVDHILEPQPATSGPRSTQWCDAMAWLPATLIIRARKQGS